MKRMLFNATQEEELRVAMVDGQRLYDLNIELPASERKKANIYKGTITRIEPSLEAAFVNYGADRHGFLPLKEISSEYFVQEHTSGGKPNIREVLKEGQDIVVQIDKEERGNKGAALTTFVSLAGRFIVLKPNKTRSGGVSRRIVGEDRDLARRSLKDVNIPDGMSVILRTAGIDRSAEELEWDLNNLLAIWEAIKTVVVRRSSPFLIYRESDAVVRALRDYLTNEIGEILIDDDTAYNDAKDFIEQVMPHNLRKLKHYVDPVPLFTRYQIETQIESAFAHQVTLPSGGSMVIDHTEALVSIDINSARATKGGDIEATALQTNLEAADEVGRQLRLRDLGGLIVIDFIDMGPQKHQREVESRLREAVRQDRARVQIGKISRFGLLEMSRQRLRPSLGESNHLTCPRCGGFGNIRSVESLALAILRIIGEEVRKERTAKVIAQLPVEVATYLLNEKRDWVQTLESRHDTQVILVANPHLETPHYQVRRVRDDQVELPENIGTSYELAEPEEEQLIPQAIQNPKPVETPAIASVVATTPAPKRKEPEPVAKQKEPGLLAKIVSLFTSGEEKPDSGKRSAARTPRKKSDARSRGGQRARRGASPKSSDGRKPARRKASAKKRSKTGDAGADQKPKDATAQGQQKKKKKKKAKKKAQPQRKASGDEKQDEARPTSGRRRSRGGRRRRRSPEGTEAAAGAQATASQDAAAADKANESAERKEPAPGRVEARADVVKDAATEVPKQAKPRARRQSREPGRDKAAEAKEARTSDQDAPPKSKPPIRPESKDAAARGKAAGYDDTQPGLPVIRDPESQAQERDRSDAGEPVKVQSAQLEAKASPPPAGSAEPRDVRPDAGRNEPRPESAARDPAASDGNGGSRRAEKPPAEKPKPKVAKAEGRLLPWEPQPDVEKPPARNEPVDK